MIRNPIYTDDDGIPVCYGRKDENSIMCTEDCPSDLSEKCGEETESDHERNPEDIGLDGKPRCFSKAHSEYSSLCQEDCSFLPSCKLATEELETWLHEAKRDIEQDKRVHLPVLNNNPIPTIVSPFANTPSPTPQPMQAPNRVPPVQYWDNSNKGYTYPTTTYASTTPQIGITQNRPNLTNEQYLAYYGVLPAANPIIAGQFEGETWYSRLFKEWLLQSCMYAVQAMGQLVIGAIGRVRWAPKQ